MFVVAQNPIHLELRPMTQLRLLGLSGSLRRASTAPLCFAASRMRLRPRLHSTFSPCTGCRSTTKMTMAITRRYRCAPCVSNRDNRWRDHDLARIQSRHVRRPEERARLGLPALWTFGAEGQAGADDDDLARLHWWRACATANERDTRIDPGASCASAPDRDRGRA